MGIKKIKQHFGIPLDVKEKDNWGIKSRTITHFPEKYFTFQIIQDYIILLFENHVNRKNYFTSLPEFKKYSQRYELNLNCLTDKDPKYIKEVVTAWNEDSFGIVTTKEHESKMNELFEAFKKKDIAICFAGKNNPFANNGLCIIIVSKIPKQITDQMYEADESYFNLCVEDEKTGIKDRLKKRVEKWQKENEGKSSWDCPHWNYMALNPRFIDPKDTKTLENTKYPIMYWLSPEHQDINNYGWYTVEQLDEWIDLKGPIVEKKDKK